MCKRSLLWELWEEADEGGSSSHLLPPISCSHHHHPIASLPPSCSPEVQLDTSSSKMHQLIAFCIFGGFGLCVAVAELSRLLGLLFKTSNIPPILHHFHSANILILNFHHMNLPLCRQLYVGFWRKEEVKAIDPNDAMDNL